MQISWNPQIHKLFWNEELLKHLMFNTNLTMPHLGWLVNNNNKILAFLTNQYNLDK